MEEKKETTKDIILERALTLFAKQGYNGVGVNEIARAAGVTKPTLYYYFKNKEGVYRAVWEKYFVIFYAELKKLALYEPHPDDYMKDIYPVLKRITDWYIRFKNTYPLFYKLMTAQVFAPHDLLTTKIAQYYYTAQYKVYEKLFTDMSKTHEKLVGKEKHLGVGFLSLLNGYMNLPTGITVDNVAVCIVRHFMHGMMV